MKYIIVSLLLVNFLAITPAFSQANKDGCQDVVYLKDKSILRGKITEYKKDGDLVLQTWAGAEIRVSATEVKRMVQKCPDEKVATFNGISGPYTFKEHGWYGATKLAVLPGADGLGFSIQQSAGYKFKRLLQTGIGAGFENFDPWGKGVPTYPIFAEVRGYLLPRNITPFYAIGVGYGISQKKDLEATYVDGPEKHWRGGWMAQGQVGYRIGNQAFFHLGIRLQQKTHTLNYTFGGNYTTIEHILHKRFDIGFGILF